MHIPNDQSSWYSLPLFFLITFLYLHLGPSPLLLSTDLFPSPPPPARADSRGFGAPTYEGGGGEQNGRTAAEKPGAGGRDHGTKAHHTP